MILLVFRVFFMLSIRIIVLMNDVWIHFVYVRVFPWRTVALI